jgi:broad specificity phosphatase PhoE
VTVHLVRHGAHEEVGRMLSGRSEIALSTEGRGEAEALVEAFHDAAIASLHASPRRRARETIAPLARARRLDVRIAPALDEIDFGHFTGQAFSALDDDDDWHRWNAERATTRCPGGETMSEAVARAVAYLEALAPEDSPALCVTHCDIIRGVVADRLGMGLDRLFELDCAPASRTTLVLDSGETCVVAINRPVLP